MSKMQQMFRQYAGGDLEKYMFLGVPGEWEETVIDQLTSKAREHMEQCLRDKPPEFSSHGQAFYELMEKLFRFAEGAVWQHAFCLMGRDEPDRSALTQSLGRWFNNDAGIESGVVSFTLDGLKCSRDHGLRPTPTTGQIAKIVAALRESLAEHFHKDDLPDVPALHDALRELTA